MIKLRESIIPTFKYSLLQTDFQLSTQKLRHLMKLKKGNENLKLSKTRLLARFRSPYFLSLAFLCFMCKLPSHREAFVTSDPQNWRIILYIIHGCDSFSSRQYCCDEQPHTAKAEAWNQTAQRFLAKLLYASNPLKQGQDMSKDYYLIKELIYPPSKWWLAYKDSLFCLKPRLWFIDKIEGIYHSYVQVFPSTS